MPLPEELLERLRCPQTRQPFAIADQEELARIRETLAEPIEAALIREDGKRAYPIRNGFPILLLEEGIDLPEKKR